MINMTPATHLPFVNTALAARARFVAASSPCGPKASGSSSDLAASSRTRPAPTGSLTDSYPWHLGINEAERALDSAAHNP
jgi:hypothetical protein